ncbi:MAG: Ig-like domain-containing protein [Patescibacteria group bacterium]|nr:Ig-like domain-containing protein [Patescibacteria group bacterium]
MLKNLKKLKKNIFLGTLFLLVPMFVYAQTVLVPRVDRLGDASIEVIVGTIIQIFLGLLGLIALILILYGGFVWMTSAGNEEKISQAKKIIISATIGLIIIFASYAIVSFVLKTIQDGTHYNPNTPGENCEANSCGGCYRCNPDGNGSVYDSSCSTCITSPNPDTNSFRAISKSPSSNNVTSLCMIQVIFNNNIEISSATFSNNPSSVSSFNVYKCLDNDCSNVNNIVASDIVGSFVTPDEDDNVLQFVVDDYSPNTRYMVVLPGEDTISTGDPIIKSTDGDNLGKEFKWEFQTSENIEVDTTPPTVVVSEEDSLPFPFDDSEDICLTSYVVSKFSEDMDLRSLRKSNSISIYNSTDYDNADVMTSFRKSTPNSTTLISTPNNDYLPNSDYYPVLKGDVIKDVCGNYLDGDFSTIHEEGRIDDYPSNGPGEDWNFSTGVTSECNPIVDNASVSGKYDGDYISITGNYLYPEWLVFNDNIYLVEGVDGLCISQNADNLPSHPCIESFSNEHINVFVPAGGETGGDDKTAKSGLLTVKTLNGTARLDFELLSPRISRVSPDQGAKGQFVTVAGENFGNWEDVDMVNSKVYFRYSTDSYIEAQLPCGNNAWKDKSIVIAVPETLPIDISSFNIQVKKVMENGDSYWSNLSDSFVLTNDIPGPGLCEIDKENARYEEEINLSGVNFGTEINNRKVLFGDDNNYIEASGLIWAGTGDNGENLNVESTVPNLSRGEVGVRVVVEKGGVERFSNYLGLNILVDAPDNFNISYISPTNPKVGSYVTIFGSGFGSSQGSKTVKFLASGDWNDGNFEFPDACSTDYWSDNKIIVKVPEEGFADLTEIFPSKLRVEDGEDIRTNEVDVNIEPGSPAPSICSINPSSGGVSDLLEISGEYFENPSADKMTFNYLSDGDEVDVTNLNISSDEYLAVNVPVGAGTGLVALHNDNGYGNSWNFEYIPGSITEEVPWDFYGWHFETCVNCENPKVRLQTCGLNGSSPSPYPGSQDVPVNSLINTVFEYESGLSAYMDVSTFNSQNIKLYNCPNTSENQCSQDSNYTQITLDNSQIIYDSNATYFTINPNTLGINEYYKVVLEDTILDEEGNSLIPYSWKFKTDLSGGECSPSSLFVYPPNDDISYPANPADRQLSYHANLIDSNCYICPDNGYLYTWSGNNDDVAVVEDSGVFETTVNVNDAWMGGLVTINAENIDLSLSNNTSLNIRADCSSFNGNQNGCFNQTLHPGFSCCWSANNSLCVGDDSPVCDDPIIREEECLATDTNLTTSSPSPYYDFQEVYLDSSIYIKFSRADGSNINMNTDSFVDGLSIEKCTGSYSSLVCNPDSSLNISIASSGNSFVEYTHAYFDVYTWYKVILSNSIEDINGNPLSCNNGTCSWFFKTNSGACRLASVSVSPLTHSMNIDDSRQYNAVAVAENCNVCNSADYTYAWSSEAINPPSTQIVNLSADANNTSIANVLAEDSGDVEIISTNQEYSISGSGNLHIYGSGTSVNCFDYSVDTCNDTGSCCWSGGLCGFDSAPCESNCASHNGYQTDCEADSCCWNSTDNTCTFSGYPSCSSNNCANVTQCINSDSCCPSGCTIADDIDCAPINCTNVSSCGGVDVFDGCCPDTCNTSNDGDCLPVYGLDFHVLSNYPESNSACPNTLIKSEFTLSINSNTIGDNVKLEKISSQSDVPIDYDVYTKMDGHGILNISPREILETSTTYRVTITGDTASGLRSTYGHYLDCSNNKCSFDFTTKASVCELGYVLIVDPENHYYEFNTPNQSKEFFVEGRTNENEPIVSIPGYSWSWNWSVFDTSLANVSGSNNLVNANLVSANNNGETKTVVSARPSNPIDGYSGPVLQDEAVLNLFMCENIWPNYDDEEFNEYFEDDDYNFRLKYCLDGGLPYLNDTPIFRTFNTPDGLLLEYIFTFKPEDQTANGLTINTKNNINYTDATDNLLSFKLIKKLFKGVIDSFISKNVLAENDYTNDVIGIRIYKNNEHLDPLSWYNSSDVVVHGNPTNTIVDGYSAIIDGRTTYINAANKKSEEQVGAGSKFTNIYLISRNQGASESTENIFNQLLDNWNFNYNISFSDKSDLIEDTKRWENIRAIDKALVNYAASNKYCAYEGASSGNINGLYYQPFGGSYYSVSNNIRCNSDSECINHEMEFHKCLETYPELGEGTYEIGASTSLWPSWNTALGAQLGMSLPIDPVNNFGNCSACVGCDPNTCWDSINHIFHCPIDSKVYIYKSGNSGNEDARALNYKLYSKFNNSDVGSWIGNNGSIGFSNSIYINNISECSNSSSAVCGDSILQGGEECEPGMNRLFCNQAYNAITVGCNASCNWATHPSECYFCGDARVTNTTLTYGADSFTINELCDTNGNLGVPNHGICNDDCLEWHCAAGYQKVGNQCVQCSIDSDCGPCNTCNAGVCQPLTGDGWINNFVGCNGPCNYCSSGTCLNYSSGKHGCSSCKSCSVSAGIASCSNIVSGQDPNGDCSGGCNRCDGFGYCVDNNYLCPSGTCSSGTCVACNNDNDCNSSLCEVCDLNSHTCKSGCDAPNCETCIGGSCGYSCNAGDTCDNGNCLECTDDNNCGPCEACVGGSCQSTCSGYTPQCNTASNSCVECINDTNCPTGEVCQSNSCVPGPECTVDNDCGQCEMCVSGSCGFICQGSFPYCVNDSCVACTNNSQCTVGCNKTCSGNTCVSSCSGSTQYCLGTSCVACITDSNCPTGKICQSNVCVNAPECTTDAQCGSCNRCDSGSCVSNCTSGAPYCFNNSCVACTNSGQCTGACNICSGNSCVLSCSGSTPYCYAGSCVSCVSSSDCNASLCQTCNASGNCVSSCSGTTPYCSAGSCVSCLSSSDCNASLCQTCNASGNCVSSCGINGNPPYCSSGTCFQCIFDYQCTGGMVCTNNQCVTPPCTLGGTSNLSGIIYDDITSTTLPGATVTLYNSSNIQVASTVSATNGSYTFSGISGLASCSYKVTAIKTDYNESQTAFFGFAGGNVSGKNLYLVPELPVGRFLIVFRSGSFSPRWPDSYLSIPGTFQAYTPTIISRQLLGNPDLSSAPHAYLKCVNDIGQLSCGGNFVSPVVLSFQMTNASGNPYYSNPNAGGGIYKYYVRDSNINLGPNFFHSINANVSIYTHDGLYQNIPAPMGSFRYWYVFNINPITGVITVPNSITSNTAP